MTRRARRLFAGRPPQILAAEAAECGLTCIAMISRYYGHDIDLNTLRKRFSPSLSGLTLRALIAMGEDLGLGCRAVRIEIEDLRRVPLPAILHWDLSHYVVLVAVSRSGITVHDPASGARRLSAREFSRHFTGVVLEVEPSRFFQTVNDRLVVRLHSLWSSSRGIPQAIWQILLLSLAVQLLVFVAPFYLQLVTDRAIGGHDVPMLVGLSLAFAALALIRTAATGLRDLLVQVIGNIVTFQLVGNVVNHLLHLPIGFFEKRHLGDVLSRVNSTSVLQDALTRGLVSGLLDSLMAATALIVMFLYAPPIAGIVLAATAVAAVATFRMFPNIRRLNEEQITAAAAERTHIMESVRALSTIKLMGREADREGRWRNLYATVVNRNTALARRRIGLVALQEGATHFSLVAVVYLGARSVMDSGSLTLGMLVAFLSFRQTFVDRANTLLAQMFELRMLGLHLERIGDIIVADREAVDVDPVLNMPRTISGAVEFVAIGFRYGGNDPYILRNLNLQVAAGEFLAITGPSGSGKTTLVKLMLGLVPPSEGTILLDGRPADGALFRWWRDSVSVVAQDDQLLSGSIAENIAFFEEGFDLKRVECAARTAQVHDDIMRMPMRYLSLVGDMGSILSGGQRQRVLLARALYRNPRVLILDEGTANLDVDTEQTIANIIAQLPITRVVVAHRPALIDRAHRVFRLQPLAHDAGGPSPLHRRVFSDDAPACVHSHVPNLRQEPSSCNSR